MDIKSLFNNILPPFRGGMGKGPFGDFNLAKPEDVKRFKKVVLNLQRETDALTRKDIADWRAAWQMAINVDFPDRRRLYDIYRDVDVDLHLSGCVDQRKGFVMARSFRLTGDDGKDKPELMTYFDTQWFKQLISHVLDANYWGHSLIELGNVTTDSRGNHTYDGVTLIPRKHVIPEFHVVVPAVYNNHTAGVDYHRPPFSQWLIEAGAPDSLGLFLKAATQTIPKKNMLAFWDTFGEIFGMPMRVARTTSRDPRDIEKLNRMLIDSGTKLTAVMGMDTEVQFLETGKTDSFNVYDKRIDRANSELSKLIIGQTMTLEDGASLSQSQTHMEVLDNIVEADCDMLRDVINDQLLPRMVNHGFPLKGIRFDWDYSTDYTPEQQAAYETMIADRYDVDPKYFEEKYGVPCKSKAQTDDNKKLSKPTAQPSPLGEGTGERLPSSFFD